MMVQYVQDSNWTPEAMVEMCGEDKFLRGTAVLSKWGTAAVMQALYAYYGEVACRNLNCKWKVKKKLFGGFKLLFEKPDGKTEPTPHELLGGIWYPIAAYLQLKG